MNRSCFLKRKKLWTIKILKALTAIRFQLSLVASLKPQASTYNRKDKKKERSKASVLICLITLPITVDHLQTCSLSNCGWLH